MKWWSMAVYLHWIWSWRCLFRGARPRPPPTPWGRRWRRSSGRADVSRRPKARSVGGWWLGSTMLRLCLAPMRSGYSAVSSDWTRSWPTRWGEALSCCGKGFWRSCLPGTCRGKTRELPCCCGSFGTSPCIGTCWRRGWTAPASASRPLSVSARSWARAGRDETWRRSRSWPRPRPSVLCHLLRQWSMVPDWCGPRSLTATRLSSRMHAWRPSGRWRLCTKPSAANRASLSCRQRSSLHPPSPSLKRRFQPRWPRRLRRSRQCRWCLQRRQRLRPLWRRFRLRLPRQRHHRRRHRPQSMRRARRLLRRGTMQVRPPTRMTPLRRTSMMRARTTRATRPMRRGLTMTRMRIEGCWCLRNGMSLPEFSACVRFGSCTVHVVSQHSSQPCEAFLE
mmetsp:Transcript_56531/g.183754  ORF Transcript_56531/g.183754 Transcript_56531/m.183754 type:complete len:392 (-) Transcript_56531:70-1245(-)